MDTSFTRMVGCRLPIQQAGMGIVASPELAIAVANAGALGMLGAPVAHGGAVETALETVRTGTRGAFGINFLMPFLDRESVLAASTRAKVVEFFYGDPDRSLIDMVHEGGALVSWQIGAVEEAKAAADAGADLVVAQGVEAGGHVRGTVALLPLLDLVLEAVDLPVIAAGGIGSARSVAAVLAVGAAGARVGTRFLAAEEADVHPEYVDALVSARAEDTVLTTTFANLWPDAPHRVLKSCVDAALNSSDEIVGQMDIAQGVRIDVPRLSPPCPGRTAQGHIEAMPHYAGQSVDHVLRRDPAAKIVDELASLL